MVLLRYCYFFPKVYFLFPTIKININFHNQLPVSLSLFIHKAAILFESCIVNSTAFDEFMTRPKHRLSIRLCDSIRVARSVSFGSGIERFLDPYSIPELAMSCFVLRNDTQSIISTGAEQSVLAVSKPNRRFTNITFKNKKVLCEC